MQIGVFEINPDEIAGKWVFFNIRTGVTHKTYGSEEEIVEIATSQSKAWEARLKDFKGKTMRKMPRGGMNAGVMKKKVALEGFEKDRIPVPAK